MIMWIVDDEVGIAEAIAADINAGFNIPVKAVCFIGCTEVMEYMAGNFELPPDILIMDIVLEQDNGIDLALHLSQRFPRVKTIFITGYHTKAQEIFLKLRPYAYLEKPIKTAYLLAHLRAIYEENRAKNTTYRFMSNGAWQELAQGEISYIESERKRIQIHATDEIYFCYEKLDEVQRMLTPVFCRCHQSFLVNLSHVRSMKGNAFILYTGKSVPISRGRKDLAQEHYFKWKGGLLV